MRRLARRSWFLPAPALASALALALAACGDDGGETESDSGETDTGDAPAYDWGLPEWYPIPAVPADNPMTAEKVELGRHLFYDERISGNGTFACASCHEQARSFSDGLVTPLGSTGDTVPKNSMQLAGAALLGTYTWSNLKLETFEQQALVPMFGTAPVELGMSDLEDEILRRFADDPLYQGLFADAFPDDDAPLTIDNVVKAIACFERTLLSYRSPYDRYVYEGDDSEFPEAAKRGMALFFDEKFECYHCHSGINFTTSFYSSTSGQREIDFQNIGLYNLDDEGAYPAAVPGLYEQTQNPADKGKFRPPPLRNVELTAPYMHDGSVATLEEVLEHYAAGGRLIEDGPFVGDGRVNPNKSEFVRGYELSDEEKADMLAFLKTLTDEAFVTDPRFASPFE